MGVGVFFALFPVFFFTLLYVYDIIVTSHENFVSFFFLLTQKLSFIVGAYVG